MATEAVRASKDVRDEGTKRDCCCICGKALTGSQRGAIQWWCGTCHRQYDLTTFGDAPEWVKFLVVDEKKRRLHFQRDETMESVEALIEAEDADEDAGIARESGELDPAIEEAELRVDGERWIARQEAQDREILAFLQDGHTQAEAGAQFGYSQQMIGVKVAALKASLQRFLGG